VRDGGLPPAVAPAAFRAGQLGVAPPSVPPSTLAGPGTGELALATGVRDGGLPAFSGTAAVDAVFAAATRGVPLAAATVPDRAGSPAGVPLHLAAPAPTILSVVEPPAALSAGKADSPGAPVPGLWPPRPRMESGNGATLEDADALLWQPASDACFAEDSWAADLAPLLPGDAAPVAGSAAVAALALALGGWWNAWPADTEPRKRQRFLIDRI
jgi:hypothetical protein